MNRIYAILFVVLVSATGINAQYSEAILIPEAVRFDTVDVNLDGNTDIIYQSATDVFALINEGDLSFSEPQWLFGDAPIDWYWDVCDLNGDGLFDLWGQALGGAVAVEQLSQGVFSTVFETPFGKNTLDLEGDGTSEIVALIYEIDGTPVCDGFISPDLVVYDYLGSGQFSIPQVLYHHCSDYEDMISEGFCDDMCLEKFYAVDMTFDGLNDVIAGFGWTGSESYAGIHCVDATTFGEPDASSVGYFGYYVSEFHFKDVDGDGDLDYTSNGSGNPYIATNTGSSFVIPDDEYNVWSLYPEVSFGEVNGDGFLDYIFSGLTLPEGVEDAGTYVFINDGTNDLIGNGDPLYIPDKISQWRGALIGVDFNQDGIDEYLGDFFLDPDYSNRWLGLLSAADPQAAVTVNTFLDANSNGQWDVGEQPLQNMVYAVDDQSYFSPPYGFDLMLLPDGTHTIEYGTYNPAMWTATNPTVQSIPVSNGIADAEEINLGYSPTGITHQLELSLVKTNGMCGGNQWFQLTILNNGNTAASGSVELQLDDLFIYNTSNPVAVDVSGNTITWSFNNVQPTMTAVYYVNAFAPTSDFIGASIEHEILAMVEDEFGDVTDSFSQSESYLLECSYDPNYIEVTPTGWIEAGFVLNDTELEYTIHFQNVGNTTATNVRIENTLPSQLDWQTLQPIAWSHDIAEMHIDNTGRLFVNFDNIMLPDSTNDEPNSHGFITYKIMMNENLSPLTEIENTAEIFFDLNEPVVTNTTLNTIMECDGLADFTFDFDSGCPGTYVLGNADSDLGETYSWTIESNEVSTGTNLYTALMESDEYEIMLHVTNPLCDVSSTQTFTVHEVIPPVITLNGNELTASGSGDFQWMWNDEILEGETSSIHIAVNDGEYTVSLLDENGCYSVSEEINYVEIAENPQPTTFHIQPNPVTDFFTIQFSSFNAGDEFVVMDAMGRVVMKEQITSKEIRVDASSWAIGVYEIRTSNNSISEKIVKE